MTLALRDERAATSPLSSWDPRWKLLSFLSFGLVGLVQPHGLLLAGQVGVVMALGLVGRVRFRPLLARAGLLLLVAVPLLAVSLLAEGGSWLRAVEATLRIQLVGLLAFILLRTDSLPRLLAAATALRFPRVLTQLLQLAYRFAFVLLAEVRRRLIALRSRGFRFQTTWGTYRTLSYSLAGVLVQSADRAERVSAAMRCRGYHGELPTLHEFRTTGRDVAGAVGLIGSGVAMLIWGLVLAG